VVCLRGTVGLSDIVTDLTSSYCHYIYSDEIDGYVHSGIFHSAKIVSRSSIVTTVADALNRYPTYSLVLTGHSLGGGCAALLTMLWSKRVVHSDGSAGFYTDTSKGFPLRKIHSYVYVN
jgi:putative lipase involved disintegration of autophagic bodies